MSRGVLYFLIGTAASFLLNYFLLGSQDWELDLYYAVALGSAWAIAYLLDTEKFSLPQKLGISLIAMLALIIVGTLIFNFKLAIPSAMKFSVVFVAYYLIASFRETKSLRR